MSQFLGKRQGCINSVLNAPLCSGEKAVRKEWAAPNFFSRLLSDSQGSLYKSFKIMRYYKNSLQVSSDCTNT